MNFFLCVLHSRFVGYLDYGRLDFVVALVLISALPHHRLSYCMIIYLNLRLRNTQCALDKRCVIEIIVIPYSALGTGLISHVF